MEIKNLELTERDFQLLIDGLDTLPEKGIAGDMMEAIFMGIIKKDGEKSAEMTDYERKRQVEKIKKEQEKEFLKEEIKILQGKLLMFKRFLIQQNALKQVDELINPQP